MGTPDFAVTTLSTIIAQGYEVVGVITAPDKPAGRGQKIKASAVKEYAVSKGLTILQPINLKDEQFIQQLKVLQANLNIVVAFRMLPKIVWDMPTYGTFNLHASLLPTYRGAAPINWAIINGEQKTGVTTFFIDEKIDTGHIILQKEVSIAPNETAGMLHDKLMKEGASLVINTIKIIENETVQTIPQPKEGNQKTAYKLNRANTKINWNHDINDIHNLIRGLNPYPTSWSILHNKGEQITVKIHDVSIEKEEHQHSIGKVSIEKHQIKVAVKMGYIIIHKIQLPGKKAMDAKSLLNGYNFSDDAKMS